MQIFWIKNLKKNMLENKNNTLNLMELGKLILIIIKYNKDNNWL